MQNRDLQYLMHAEPSELMALTNGIPAGYCCLIKAQLLAPGSPSDQVFDEAAVEYRRWLAAGAEPVEGDEISAWLRKGSDCDECGNAHLGKPARRFAFTRGEGFFWLHFCLPCARAFDTRWQGRCFAPKAVSQ